MLNENPEKMQYAFNSIFWHSKGRNFAKSCLHTYYSCIGYMESGLAPPCQDWQ